MMFLSHYTEEQSWVKRAQSRAHMSKVILVLVAINQFNNAHNFIYIFKFIKSDVTIGYYKYKN